MELNPCLLDQAQKISSHNKLSRRAA